MKASKAFAGGVVGGAVMSVGLAVARLLGFPVDLEMTLGTMVGLAPGSITWVVGLAIHLTVSGLIGLIYGLGFEYVAHGAGALPGVVFSLPHIVVGGLAMGTMPTIHPQVPQVLPAPGAFLSNIGDAGVIAFVALHAVYGAVVGVMYGPVVHPSPPSERTSRFAKRAPTA